MQFFALNRPRPRWRNVAKIIINLKNQNPLAFYIIAAEHQIKKIYIHIQENYSRAFARLFRRRGNLAWNLFNGRKCNRNDATLRIHCSGHSMYPVEQKNSLTFIIQYNQKGKFNFNKLNSFSVYVFFFLLQLRVYFKYIVGN